MIQRSSITLRKIDDGPCCCGCSGLWHDGDRDRAPRCLLCHCAIAFGWEPLPAFLSAVDARTVAAARASETLRSTFAHRVRPRG